MFEGKKFTFVSRWLKRKDLKEDHVCQSCPLQKGTFTIKPGSWVEHLNTILAPKDANMNEPFFKSSGFEGGRGGDVEASN